MDRPTYKDYYAILGVPRSADDKDIKAAYRRLARQFHPDVNPGSKQAEERFKEISEAHEVLGDPHKRAQYDSFGEQWKRASQGPGPRPGGDSGFGFGQGLEFDLGGGGGGMGEFLDSLFGNVKGRRERAASRGEDVEFAINVTLVQVMTGTSQEHSLKIRDVCPRCRGGGMPRGSHGAFNVGQACAECRSTGAIEKTRRVNVKIPAGVEDGKRLCLKGQGGASANGVRGDLYLVVHVQPNSQFERQGNDIVTDVSIPFTVAALGGEAEVTTLTGTRTLNVPPGLQSGQRLRIAGQGVPSPEGRGGDLYARVSVAVPKGLSPRERELICELAALRGDRIRD